MVRVCPEIAPFTEWWIEVSASLRELHGGYSHGLCVWFSQACIYYGLNDP